MPLQLLERNQAVHIADRLEQGNGSVVSLSLNAFRKIPELQLELRARNELLISIKKPTSPCARDILRILGCDLPRRGTLFGNVESMMFCQFCLHISGSD